MGYSVVMTVTGVEFPPGVTLGLNHGAVVVNNPITLDQADAPSIGPNATLYRQPRLPDGRFKEAARYLLGFELPDKLSANSETVRAISEVIVFPLRLVTKGSITLRPATISRRPLQEILAEGSESVAPIPQPGHLVTTLSEEDCAKVQSNLLVFRIPQDWESPAARFTEAYYKEDLIEQSLTFLVALETLITPSNESRGRSSDVQRWGALLAATERTENSRYRKLIGDAYKQRDVLRHGEADAKRLKAARQWLFEHREDLGDICRRSFQRALRLRKDGKVSSLSDIANIAKFMGTERDKAPVQIWQIPVITLGRLAEEEFLQGGLSHGFSVGIEGSGSVHFNVS